jgi:hypothetical protein
MSMNRHFSHSFIQLSWQYTVHMYIYEIIVYIKSNLNLFTTNSGIHSYNIRQKEDLFIVPCNISLCINNFNNLGLRMLNHLPQHFKEIPALYKFRNALKSFLLDHCFYSLEELFLFGK